MKIQKILKNKITGFLFGKYDLEDIILDSLIHKEKYKSGIEIIDYNEAMYISIVILAISTVLLSFFISVYFILIIIILFYLIFIATQLEITLLTDERIIIEKRGYLEKILKTQNVQTLSIDQIAVLSYRRAPFQYPSLILGISGIFISTSSLILFNLTTFQILILLFPILIVCLYLIWYGLRINKRSIELSIIGISYPIWIGKRKGAPKWFLNDIQNTVFERIHHVFHEVDLDEKEKLKEFPLQYTSRARELIGFSNKELHQDILELLDQNNSEKKEIIAACKDYTKSEIDEAMRQLRQKKFIFYDRGQNLWCLNRDKEIARIKDKKK